MNAYQILLILLIVAVVIALIAKNFPTHTLEESTEEVPPFPEDKPGEINPPDQEAFNRQWAMQYARSRLSLPTLFLMGLGGINLVLGAVVLTRTVQVAWMPMEDFEKEMAQAQDLTKKLFPQFAQTLDGQELTPAKLRKQTLWINGGMSALLLLGSYLMSVGGWQLRQLRSYRLGLAGAVYAALPCVSIAGCCGIGQLVAAWAVFILWDPMVRAAFHWASQNFPDSPDSLC